MSKRIRGSFQVDKDLNLSNSTANRALTTDASKNLTPSATTDTQVGYLSTSTGVTGSANVVLSNNSVLTGVTSAVEVQTPLVSSANSAGVTNDIDVSTGVSSGSTSGNTYLETGNGASGSGFVAIATGDSSGGNTGDVSIQSGTTPTNDSGDVSLLTGVAGAGSSGNIILSTGAAGVTQGSIQLTAPTVTASNHLAVTGTLKTNTIDTPSAGTLAIGTSTASIVNIGKSGGTVNINGTVLYENVTQLQVTDPLVTINKGGGTGSASNSGIEIEENSVITGYAETSADRNSWILKAPNTAGVVTVTPGASGFTLSQAFLDSKANADLGNLTSPTAINQNLLPDTTETKDLGSASKKFQDGYFKNITIDGENTTEWAKFNGGAILFENVGGLPGIATKDATSDGQNTDVITVATGSQQSVTGTSDTGLVTIYSGYNAGTGNSGHVYINSGWTDGNTSNSGDLNLTTGTTSGTGSNSGTIYLETGDAPGGVRGIVRIDGQNVQFRNAVPVRFNDADSTNYIALKAPNVLSADTTLTLPTGDGTNRQVLITNGSGQLSFTTPLASDIDPNVSNTEFGYLDGVTSPIQTQLGNKANTTLNNLGSTSVNADVVWDGNNTRSLGSDANEANSLWAFNVKHNDSGTPDLKLSVTGNSGNIVLDSHGQSTQQFSTSNTVLFSTNVLTGGIAAGTVPNNSASDTLSGVSLGTTGSPFISVVSPQYLAPNTVISKSGLSYSSGVTTINISDTSNLLVGMSVNGTGIQDGTIIISVTTNTSITINLSTNAVGSSTTLNFVSALTTRTPDVSSGSNFTGNATFRSGNTVDGLSGQVTVRSGDVSGTGRSASTTLRSGNHTNTSNTSTTGGITVRSGDHSGTGSASSGSVTIRSGTVAGTTASGSSTFSTGASSGTGASGNYIAGSGNNTSTGVSGSVTITTGTTTSVTSGTVFVGSGAPTSSGNSGTVTFRSGTVTSGTSGISTFSTGGASTGASGASQLKSGDVSAGTGVSGNVIVTSGNATGGNSGALSMGTGTSSTAASGDITFATGNVTAGTGNSGNIGFNPGTSFGGTKGEIRILGDGTNRSTVRFFNGANSSGTGLQAPTSSDGTTYTLPGTLGSNGQALYTDASGVLGFKSVLGSITGDIDHTSFAAADNQASPVNVTGLAFANGSVRSFEALLSVYINATTPLYESFKIYGVQKASSWDISYTSVGDSSGIAFSITNAGQVQYTSTSNSGFVSSTMKFRAQVTGV